MLRTIVPLIIGAAVGLAAAYLVTGAGDSSLDGRDTIVSVAAGMRESGDTESVIASAPTGELYLAAYRAAGQFSRPDEIESRLAALFSSPFSTQRDAEIAALFERLAALDLRRSIRVAEVPGFDVRFIAKVFGALAEQNEDDALRALSAVRSPMLQVELALAVLATLGNNAGNLQRVAAALPEHQRVNLQIEALGELARNDPDGAMDRALALSDEGLRSAAAQRVGAEWTHQDPEGAYAVRESLPTELREPYRDAVAVEWARLDSGDFLRFADSQPMLADLLLGLMHTLGVASESTYQVATTHAPQRLLGSNVTMERRSFEAAAAEDFERYLALVEAMPSGQKKREYIQAFAESYGRTRPEEALAWARTRNNPLMEALVIRNVRVYDHALAYRMMLEFAERYRDNSSIQSMYGYIATNAAGDSRRGEVATELLQQSDNPIAATLLNQIMRLWVQNDAKSAFDWMLASGSEVDPGLAATIAGRLAARDAKEAAEYIDQVPPDLRQSWLERVTTEYARQDPEGVAVWLPQFLGEPGYETLFARAVVQVAQVDPRRAALMVAATPMQYEPGVVISIANGLAQQDLSDAARWAMGLGEENDARESAVSQVAAMWAYRDPRAAQRWAANLPRGGTRDLALSAVLNRLSRDGFHVAIDEDILSAYDSDNSRNQAVSRLIDAIAVQDPDRAEVLLEDWLDDPLLRDQEAQAIRNARASMGL